MESSNLTLTTILLTLVSFANSQCNSTIDCWKAFECANTTMTNICPNCYALGSCFEIENPSSISCESHRSCQGATNIYGNSHDLGGMFSLLQATNIIATDDTTSLACFGEASCYGFKGTLTAPDITCQGINSCNNWDIFNASHYNIILIRVTAMFSFQNNIIYSYNGINNTETFTVSLSGLFSGYNTTIICLEGHSCQLGCFGNSCKNVNFICNTSTSDCSVICNEKIGRTCPNHNVSHAYNYIQNYDLSTFLNLIESNPLSTPNNTYFISNTSNNYITQQYNKYSPNNPYYNYSLINDPYDLNIGCEPADSSKYICTDFNTLSDCRSENLDLTHSEFETGEKLCCRGHQSCQQSTIDASRPSVDIDVICFAYQSCRLTTMTGNGNNSIECTGRRSCRSADINTFNNVLCTGRLGCWDAVITTVNYIGCFGYRSCSEITLRNVGLIYSTGYQSMADATIDNSGLDRFYIYLLDYDSAMDGFSVLCDNDIIKECIIYCYNDNSCQSLTDDDIMCNCSVVTLTQTTTSPTMLPTATPTRGPTQIPTVAPSRADGIETIVELFECNDCFVGKYNIEYFNPGYRTVIY